MTQPTPPTTNMTAWEKNLLGIPLRRTHTLLPGLLAVIVLTALSVWMADLIGVRLLGFDNSPISPVMIAIILGIAIGNLLTLPTSLKPGLTFTIKKVLRLGIILLGIRLTVFDVLRLGGFGVPIVVICIIGALLITTWINRLLRLPERLGTLIAVGTSICGVTAIVATAPAIDADEEESAYAVAVITAFGLFATLVYPYLANAIFSGDALRSGLFLGTAVHETAQVVGAAKIYTDIYSQTLALDVATVTKLVRNVFMALVIPLMAYYYARKSRTGEYSGQRASIAKLFPMFILGFLGMAVLRSIGDAGLNAGGTAFGLMNSGTWGSLIDTVKTWAERFLVAALAGVGLNTNFRSFKALGVKPFLVGLAASFSVGMVSFVAILLLGGLVAF